MAGQQAENTLYENGIGWAILAVVFLVLALVFWHFQAEEVRNIIRWIRFGEAWILQWFVLLAKFIGLSDGTFTFNGHDYSYSEVLNGNPNKVKALIASGGNPNSSFYYGMIHYDKNALTFMHLSLFNAMTVGVLKYVFIATCGAGAIWAIFKGPKTYYRSYLGLEGLIHRQASNFPVISPFVHFNPSTQPPRPPGSPVPAELPDFAEALGPEEWLAYNQIPTPDGKLDEAALSKAFQKQLINRWKGVKALKPHQQILLAAFCLKASRKRDAADDLLGRAALCWSLKNGLDLKKDKKLLGDARKVLRDKKLAAKTLTECNKHAFVTTALLRGLNFARSEGGVLAPAQFVWLRSYERILWYPLNNLGRQSFHMEALGAMSHYKAEKLTDRPIPVPKVEYAVQTITDYMKSSIARPIPQLDYSQSSKSGIKKAK